MNNITVYNALMEILSVTKVSAELNISRGRVIQLITAEKLSAQKVGREWAITRPELERFKLLERKPGKDIIELDDPLTLTEISLPKSHLDELQARADREGVTLSELILFLTSPPPAQDDPPSDT